MKKLALLCGVLLTIPLSDLSAGGQVQVLRVPADFLKIQQAVNAAAPGDTIMVSPGTYCENVVITTPGIRLRAAPAVGQTGAILSACGGGGFGIHVSSVSNVEISGFTIAGFESGIVLHNVTSSRLHLNEVHHSVYKGSSTPFYARAQGILLISSSFNDITQNLTHHNGHLGIGLFNSSSGNLVRGNRLLNNQTQQASYGNYFCSLMVWGTTGTANRIVENEVTTPVGYGIMISPGQVGNLVAQNRVDGHPFAGIVVMSSASGNLIQQNNAVGNGPPALWDFNAAGTNTWQRNLGDCTPGNAACQ